MRFYTYLVNGTEMPCFSKDGGNTISRLNAFCPDITDIETLIKKWDNAKNALETASADEMKAAAIDVEHAVQLAPIVRPSRDVVCLGINYTAHAEEAGSYSREAFGGDRPYTIYFSKRVNRATGSSEPIPAYVGLVDSLDYEVELGVVLKKDIRGIGRDEVADSIFGFTVVNDVSARNLQTRHKQWYLGKSLDGFLPMGPCIVTPDELGDPKTLGIRSYVNGEIRQNSNTSLMLQTIEGAVTELCAGMTLQAGTIIATGTPAGVGMGMKPPCFLKPGDAVACEIEGIGRIENRVEG